MQLYSPKSLGNYFIERARSSGDSISPMKLQKLVYYAAGWYAGYTGRNLIDEAPQAWQYGPVFSSLYEEFKEYGSASITKKATVFNSANLDFTEVMEPQDPDIRKFLDNIWDSYGKYTGIALSEMTHTAGSPWDKTWKRSHGARNISIPFELLQEHFKQAADRARAGVTA